MALVLPYPNSPQNGQTGDAAVILANQTAIAQSIQSFDGSQVQGATLPASAMVVGANPITRGAETIANFVPSGMTVSVVSGLNISVTGGTAYINGVRMNFVGVGSKTLTANQDTYIDVDSNGNIYYVAVANGATGGMTLTTNSIRIAKVVTGASTVGSITQNGFDPLGNCIYNTNPNQIELGYAFITSGFSTSSTTATQVTGLSVPVIIPANGRRVKITAYCGQVSNNSSGAYTFMSIWDGVVGSGTQLNGGIPGAIPGANAQTAVTVVAIANLPAGTKTYNVGLSVSGGSASMGAGSTLPAFILVEAI